MIKIFAVLILIITFAAFFAPAVLAQVSCRSVSGGYCVNLAAAVPGLEFLNLPENPSAGDIIGAVYKTALGLVGISALIMVVVGGVMYLTAGDSTGQIAKAKSYMKNATFGLVLAFLAWLILNTINPQLVQNLNLKLETISGMPFQTLNNNFVIKQGDTQAVQKCADQEGKIVQSGTQFICKLPGTPYPIDLSAGSTEGKKCLEAKGANGIAGGVVCNKDQTKCYCTLPFK